MKLITKKNFLPIVCSVYTIISLGKLVYELLRGYQDPFYTGNFFTIFIVAFFAVLILSLHNYLQNVSVILLIIVQYGVLIALIFGGLYVLGHMGVEVSANAYRDMFISFTCPYILGIIIYYGIYFYRLNRANRMLLYFQKESSDYNID